MSFFTVHYYGPVCSDQMGAKTKVVYADSAEWAIAAFNAWLDDQRACAEREGRFEDLAYLESDHYAERAVPAEIIGYPG
jgi:hypothetical protein